MQQQDEKDYILGTHDAELERLGLQHSIWREQAHALWRRAGFRPGQTILDAGCGPGFASLDLARLLGPESRIIAVDESQRFISHLRAQQKAQAVENVDAFVADVRQLREMPGGVSPESVDGAYVRWVLCWVDDPEAVVAGIARLLRPGGVIAVQDYFNYLSITLAPRGPALERVVQAVGASQRASGGDPDLCGRVPGWLIKHGLEVREIRPILRVARPGDPLWQWPDTFFRNYVPRLVQRGFLKPAEQAAFEVEWEQRSRDPASFFVTPPVFDIVGVKR
ncbi:MAG: methyltransferase domain-containing protein [Planctomycetes bacterium]|nr:methyltransferase domain-containing protein [Planctomycetota bacterium]